jgi:RNA polymerase sigma-70 factor (ECF subfamily)
MVDVEYKDKSDAELVGLALANPTNYRYLIIRYEDRLLAYIKRLLSVNTYDAKDVLQESFIKVYRNLNGYNPKYKFSSWIYRITHNEAITFFRSRKNELANVHSEYDQEMFETFASEVDLEADMLDEAKRENVHRSLEQLEEKYRSVLILKFIEEKDYNEISDILKLPLGTVGSLIARAKIILKEIIQKNGHI